jgi:hypothetical protein
MKYWLWAFLIVGVEGFLACAATRTDRPPRSVTELTSGFNGPGYSGTTAYGQTNGPQGDPTRGPIYAWPDGGRGDKEKDQNGGTIPADTISR